MSREVIDVGNYVECDWCRKEFTNSDRCGGLLFGSKAVCPDCAPRVEATAKQCGEEQFIRQRCPEGVPFRDWVLQLRGGDNTITVVTGDDFDELRNQLMSSSMSIVCTRCDGTGFLNVEQVPNEVRDKGSDAILNWIEEQNATLENMGGCACHIAPPCSYCLAQHDVSICDCCGNGDGWHGQPGQHYGADDPPGTRGPYAYNGGLCECH